MFSQRQYLIINIYIIIINTINEENRNKKKNSNEIINKRKKKFKLSFFELLLPSFLFRKNQNIKLFNEYKNFFSSIISVKTLINYYLQNSNINSINDNNINIYNQILPLTEQDSDLNSQFLDNTL